jgi:hypothetical protein
MIPRSGTAAGRQSPGQGVVAIVRCRGARWQEDAGWPLGRFDVGADRLQVRQPVSLSFADDTWTGAVRLRRRRTPAEPSTHRSHRGGQGFESPQLHLWDLVSDQVRSSFLEPQPTFRLGLLAWLGGIWEIIFSLPPGAGWSGWVSRGITGSGSWARKGARSSSSSGTGERSSRAARSRSESFLHASRPSHPPTFCVSPGTMGSRSKLRQSLVPLSNKKS